MKPYPDIPGYGRGGSWSICAEWFSPRANFDQFEGVKLRVGLGRGVRYYKELRIRVRVTVRVRVKRLVALVVLLLLVVVVMVVVVELFDAGSVTLFLLLSL